MDRQRPTIGLDYHRLRQKRARSLRQARAKRQKKVRRQRYSRTAKIGWLANGFIWTIAVWGVLFLLVLQESQTLRLWLQGVVPPATVGQPRSVDAVSMAMPEPTDSPPATPTATRVVLPTTAVTGAPIAAKPVTTLTATPSPTALASLGEALQMPPPQAEVELSGPDPGREFVDEPAASSRGSVTTNNDATTGSLNLPSDTAPVADDVQQSSVSLPVQPTAVPDRRSGLPTRLVIGSINLDAAVIPVGWRPIFDGSQVRNEWEVARYAVGWHKNSTRPGEGGNTVLSAHSNVEGEVFRFLADVTRGNIISVYVDGIPFDYEIDLTTIVKEAGEPMEVRERNAQWIAATADERLTLVTCWPYPHSTHRLIVVAKPVSS